ncbi:MAG TPA: hypothetical protein VJS13_16915 [Pyrinomonadaceae bacterium]|nr:hypothetical protein [Pyrinomonadaceae bacterium]
MRKIILLFLGSFLVTAVFSASLKVFFQTVSWREVLTKGLLIPCFTWTIQLLLSAAFLDGRSRLIYWNRLGWVCLIGSIALLPAAFYNLLTVQPSVWLSIANVLASVVLMAITLHVLLRRDGFRWQWTFSWVVLIVVNMSLYLSSVL